MKQVNSQAAGPAVRLNSGFNRILLIGTALLVALAPMLPTSSALAQGCGGMMNHGGAQSMNHEMAPAQKSVLPVWTNILQSRAGLHSAVEIMSKRDAEFYGKLLRDDVQLLSRKAPDLYPGVEEPLKATSNRVRDLTKHLLREVKATNREGAEADLAHLDVEIDRIVTLFPQGTLPVDMASDLDATESVTSQGSPSSVQSATYVCPMHPDVKSKEPGDCSKCGMALVKTED